MGDGEAAALAVVAEGDEGAFELAVVGVAGNAHFNGELADADEVLGGAEGELGGILFRSEVVGSPQAVHVEVTVAVSVSCFVGVRAFTAGPVLAVGVEGGGAVHAHGGFQLAVHGASVVYIGHGVDTDTEAQFIVAGFIVFVYIVIAGNVLHPDFRNVGQIACLLFQFRHTDAKALEFAGIFGGQLPDSSLLAVIQASFLSHKAGNDLGQFITAYILIPFECTVGISIHHTLVGQLGYSLVGPGGCIYISKGIGSGNIEGGGCKEGSQCGFQKAVVHFLSPELSVSSLNSQMDFYF